MSHHKRGCLLLLYEERAFVLRSPRSNYRIPVPKKVKAIPNREVLYTGTIIEYINDIDDKEKLIQYIIDNIDDFQYNNATAIKYIPKNFGLRFQKQMVWQQKKGAL